MAEQNFKNHSRYVPFHHFVAPTLILALMVGSFINLADCIKRGEGLYSASLICLVGPILTIIWWYSRVFALRAQDRAIRAELNFRYFVATGKPLSSNLRMRQIIALRFAGDDEFTELVKRAENEKLGAKEIKASIKNWKADHHRV
ncbi:MAG TPA: DUF6526 family protein [Ferruginibacter sp.]|nr:DUF6526 family protein [Ferruginibacter sp.]